MSQPIHIFLQALAILMFISSSLTDLNEEQLLDSFNVQMDSNYGGSCDRDLPITHEPMLPIVLKAFDEAWSLSEFAITRPALVIDTRSRDIESDAAFTRLRAMLFGFFGINLTSTGQFAADSYSEAAFEVFQDEFEGVDILLTDPSDTWGLGLPKCFCTEDYSEFRRYMADDYGTEEAELGLAAQHYGQTYPNGILLPGLMYVRQHNVYYRGTDSNPELGACALGDTIVFAVPVTQGPTSLYGITVCAEFFGLQSLSDIPDTNAVTTVETSQSLYGTWGAVLLVNLLVMQSRRGLTSMPRVEPQDGNWESLDFTQWQFANPISGSATSFEDCANLGLAKPQYALGNAPSYVHFALCLAYDDLECFS